MKNELRIFRDIVNDNTRIHHTSKLSRLFPHSLNLPWCPGIATLVVGVRHVIIYFQRMCQLQLSVDMLHIFAFDLRMRSSPGWSGHVSLIKVLIGCFSLSTKCNKTNLPTSQPPRIGGWSSIGVSSTCALCQFCRYFAGENTYVVIALFAKVGEWVIQTEPLEVNPSVFPLLLHISE